MRQFQEQPFFDEAMPPYIILANGSKYFDRVCFLNSNEFTNDPYSSFDWVIALGCHKEIKTSKDKIFESLKEFSDKTNDWIFGFLCYDLKNQTEKLSSSNIDNINLDLAHFFQPEILIICKEKKMSLGLLNNDGKWSSHSYVWSVLTGTLTCTEKKLNRINIKPRVEKPNYISDIKKIKEHIQRGDIYEMNYCVEFFGENSQIDPLQTYWKLNELSPAPFSAYYRLGDKYLMCSSPERFIKKAGDKIISQPIKGTVKRGNTISSDKKLKEELFNDPKERSENIMIVDLVRNDLAKTAVKGSVKVEELCGVYTFAHVHHMVSTITSCLSNDSHYTDAIRKAFPMGSMTGAPKVRAMEIIEQYESTKRGLYSGCLGYINADKDFDFNVIIRSILYNQTNRYVNYMVGGAITSGSDPEKEYNECLLKAKAMNDVLNDDAL